MTPALATIKKKLRQFWWLPGIGLPALLITLLVVHYTRHVPFWDQWEFVDLLRHHVDHTLSFNDFWHQHNEHRIFFPRLIMYGLAMITGWDPFWEVIVNLLLGFGILAVILAMIKQSFKGSQRIWLSILASVMILSPMQWENWLWGWQIQWFLSLLAAIGAIYALTRPKLERRHLIWAVVCGVIATFSLANGFVVWGLGIFLLLMRRVDLRKSVLWFVLGVASVGAYYYKYVNPAYHPSKTLFLHQPVAFVEYIIIYLGSSISLMHHTRFLIGLAILAVFCLGVLYMWQQGKSTRKAMLPWLGIGLYAGAGAVLTAISRLGFGLEQASTSRYTSVSLFFVLSTVAITVLVWQDLAKKKKLPEFAPLFAVGMVAAVSVCTLVRYDHGVYQMRGQYAHMTNVEKCLGTVTSPDDPCLTLTYPSGPVAYERLQFLRQYHYGGRVQLRSDCIGVQ